MSEIKFRAWDTKLEKWYTPTHEAYKGKLFELLVSFSGDLTAHVIGGVEHQSLWPDRFVLMKYTGIKDKNGELDVFENDVVRLSRYLGTPGKFDIVTGVVRWYAPEFKVDINGEGFTRCELHGGAEVIGNIYENPELLEETKSNTPASAA